MASDFTVDRNSPKWVLGPNGVLTEYAADEPAIEFNADGSYKGVLVERSATQLLGGDTHTSTTQTVIVTAAEHTLSFYGTGSVVLSGAATGTLTGSGTSAERVSLTFTPSAGLLTLTVSGSPKYWQLETGPIATSYIRNTGSVGTSVIRVKDEIYLLGASSLIGQKDTGGTVFIEVDWRLRSGFDQYLFSINDNSNNNRVDLVKIGATEFLTMILEANDTGIVSQGESSASYSGIQKFALAYAQNDVELYRNGTSISDTTSADLTSLATMSTIDFSQSSFSGSQSVMWIRAVALYKERLTDTKCEELTTI